MFEYHRKNADKKMKRLQCLIIICYFGKVYFEPGCAPLVMACCVALFYDWQSCLPAGRQVQQNAAMPAAISLL